MIEINNIIGFGAELFAWLRKAPTLTGAYNTGYMAHFVRPNRLSPTSYSPILLSEMPSFNEEIEHVKVE